MITYKIAEKANLIIIRNQGYTPVDECIALMKQLRNDPEYSHEFDVINDNRKLESAYTHAELQQIIEIRKKFDTDLPPVLKKNAIVVERDLYFGISRMYETLSELNDNSIDNMVFRSFDEALEWLGQNPDDIDLSFE